MINSIRGKTFNIPNSVFIQDSFFVSFSRLGTIVKDGFKSPDSGNAIASSKLMSIKKAYSEVIERRSLMIGGLPKKNNMVDAFDLINQTISSIPYRFSTYSKSEDFPIDTTGTAVHYDSNEALKNALKELLEKNALFLFWYGNKGYRIKESKLHNNKHWEMIGRENYNLIQYFSYVFPPFYNVLTVVQKHGMVYSAGLGFHSNFVKAQEKSLEEAYLLLWQNKRIEITNKELPNIYYEHYKINEKLSKYPLMKVEKIISDTQDIQDITIDELIGSFPEWVKELYMIFLRQEIDSRLTCIKVFSRNLYNHVPIKEYINLNNDINRNTIRLTKGCIEKIPNCIFV